MDRKKLFVILLGFLFTLLLTGCNCSNANTLTFEVLPDGPAPGSIVDAHPLFSWHEEESCTPDKYRLRVTNDWSGAINSALEYPAGGALTHTWTGTMQAGLHAYWRMAASTEDDVYLGPYSVEHDFYVGPLCSGQTLVAPELYRPIEAGWISHNHQEPFEWHYKGGCLPPNYDYQFATDLGFTDIVDSGTTPDYKQILNKSFPNCSSLFWRVRANDGTSTGPWSDARQFHWVTDDTCWQLHYISDDAARISVRLYDDICEMTGYSSSTRSLLDPGCTKEKGSNFIHGDGEYAYPPDHTFYGFRVELGSGPCPSTGLDSRVFGGLQFFYVVAPGTYCVSITRDQEADSWGETKDLMDGMWTDPLGSGVIAEKTLELGSGLQDVLVEFGWDEYEQIILWYPIPENINCRRGPDTICDPLKIPLAGEILPILARDMETEWKMTSYQGETCFVYLTNAQINEAVSKVSGNKLVTEDLPFYEPQPPCPTPTPVPQEHAPTGCAQYTTERSCIAAKCDWHRVNDTTSICIPY